MKLGTLFSDHAVLQCHRAVRVWGDTLPGLPVKAEIAGKCSFARASACGEFQIELPPLEAGGPYDLTVFSPENEVEKVIVHDVLAGEVWFCSGQSNMQYRLGTTPSGKKPHPAEHLLARRQEQEFKERVREPEKFRFYTSPIHPTGCREKYSGGEWQLMTEENASSASAVAAWFGLRLREKLQVPVGLICCSKGATNIETWTSPEALKINPDTRHLIERWEELRRNPEIWVPGYQQTALLNLSKPDDGNRGYGQGWADGTFDDSGWKTMRIPGSWIQQGISGCGAVWIRRKIELPRTLAGQDLTLHLGGVDKHDITYFNGVEIGRMGTGLDAGCWNTPRIYSIPGELVKAGENTIAVRGFSFQMDGAFTGSPDSYCLAAPDGTKIPVNGTWRAKAEYDRGRISWNSPEAWNPGNDNTPGILFDSAVRPLLPYAVRGVIWYQGEANTADRAEAAAYQRKLETLIRDWRFRRGLPELPFLVVQLPNYREPSEYDGYSVWAVLRESQRAACASLPNAWLISALDAGEAENAHPQDKKTIGFRLAAQALNQVYGQHDLLPCGPEFLSLKPEKNGALRLFFRWAEGMELRGDPGKSFYLAGTDGKYPHAGSAKIEGDTIVLSSSAVKAPVSVRYAWADNPSVILYNPSGPAAAFSGKVDLEPCSGQPDFVK